MRKPDFNNMLKVLRKEAPDRPTLFEFFLNTMLYERLAGEKTPTGSKRDGNRFLIKAFAEAGYDYATVHGSDFGFPANDKHRAETISLNDNATIVDRESFDRYSWPDPDAFDYTAIEEAEADLPDGMKLMLCGPGGVLENVIGLTGYDNLCIMIYEDPQLVYDLFEKVGSSLLQYYINGVKNDSVGILMSNDDWGFKTQTMLSPAHMREFVFPWHKKIVDLAHDCGKPAILHSCGFFGEVMDDVIDVLKYDGKHSYEDTILSVEESYQKWGSRIAILGGIDLHFVVTRSPEEIRKRSADMLSMAKTGYALGTGNSVPEYVPPEHYFAMIEAATKA